MALPLEGVRVVEMGQLIAIPHAIKLMADMGAEVIRIESCTRQENYRATSFYRNNADGDYWDRAANFYEQNRNKLGLTLELSKPRGLELLRELISISDVFAENFTPRVMRNFRLEYEDVRQIRPDIIMVSSTGYGYTGPWADFGAIGYTTEAASGLAYVTGYKDGPPAVPEIPHADYVAAEHTLYAVMTALIYRARTGRGQFIDVSQTETVSSTVPEALMDYAVNARIMERMGNQDATMAPHGCYPCRGADNWIAIAVSTDEQWWALCEALGNPSWGQDVRFREAQSRWTHSNELDALLGQATSRWDKRELMCALQGRGVPAGAVLNSKELLGDPHLGARRFYEVVAHHPSTGMPPLPYPSRPWKMSATPGNTRSAAPILGEHNRLVLSEILAMSADEVLALERDGVVGYAPVDQPRPPIIPLEDQKRLGRIVDYELPSF